MKPHLLYIAFWYPPSRASGVYRALATTREFIAAGWDVTVITCTREFLEDEIGSTDESLLAEISSNVEVVRVPFTFGLAVDVRSLSWFSANFPTLARALHQRTASLRGTIATITGGARVPHRFADNYVTWIEPVVEEGARIHSRHGFDHVLATGNPYSSFEAARLLAGITGTGFSVDYRDPWTIDVFTGNAELTDRATTAAERRIVEGADNCFHVNEAIARAYRRLYPEYADKHQVVHNGYDAESIPPPPRPATPPYKFGILGTANDRWPLDAIFKAWNASLAGLPAGSELLLAGHLGYFSRSQDVLEAYLPDEASGFRYIGPVPKADVADFYDSIDVLILPVPGGVMVTSGKVFEALALGKPIVCVQSKGGGARALLEDHPLAIGAEPNAESVESAIGEAARMARDLDPSLSAEVRSKNSRYERHVAMQPMVDAITSSSQTGDRA
jgi:glycosyltransferase involved in cell wall biosynthesis